MIVLTEEQQKAHDRIVQWSKKPTECLTLGGLAGTGKTTLLGALASTLKSQGKRLAFCTVSGKATAVLKTKLAGILGEQDFCGTIHKLIYALVGKERQKNGRDELYFNVRDEIKLPYDLIIVDEASMLNEWIYNDLRDLGLPIIAVGDHGQLPPVKGSFNLMASPHIRLETIMRQGEGNPIIDVAMNARTSGKIEFGGFGPNCQKTRELKVLHGHDFASLDSIMICAINRTRVRMNDFAREKLGRGGKYPMVGEPVICLYNNHKRGIYNGNIGVVIAVHGMSVAEDNKTHVLFVDIDFGDFIYSHKINADQFGREYTQINEDIDDVDYFDFAYCITCHKSQGSEWKNVLVLEEGEFMFRDGMWNRWLYTACTRAKDKLTIYKK